MVAPPLDQRVAVGVLELGCDRLLGEDLFHQQALLDAAVSGLYWAASG